MPRAKQPSPSEQQDALSQVYRLYGHRENFTAADIGFQWTDGKPTDRIAVRVHVKRKIPEAELESTQTLPKEINKIPLDVIEGDYGLPEAMQSEGSGHRSRMPFLIGGGSCGRMDNGAGTIGMLVVDRATRQPALLSNWHVLAGPHAQVGDDILHPGLADTQNGAPPNGIAKLSAWMLGRDGDAAIARLKPQAIWVPLLLGVFREIRSARRVELGEILTKSGRTTGVTQAKVDGIGTYRIEYEVKPGRWEYRDIQGFKLVPEAPGNPDNLELSGPGDSGSCWASVKDGAAVGLHFAGETDPAPGKEHAVGCHIEPVLDRLGIDIATFDDLFDAAKPANENQPELTPRPDAPGWPVPWPVPFPIPCPGPLPGPWAMPDYPFVSPGRLAVETTAPAKNKSRLAKLKAIHDMLMAALSAYIGRPVDFPITGSVSGLVQGPASPYDVICAAVNNYPPFEHVLGPNVGLERPIASYEIEGSKTYLQVCTVILQIIEG